MKIVGIAGLPRSGKDTLAEMFISAGYYGVSLGDIVRDQARIRHADKPDPISVANMTETANHLRETNGADFALKQALAQFASAKKAKNYKGLVVYSVRSPAEVDFILGHGGELIWVESNAKVRHARQLQHQRPGEVELTLSEFLAQERLQEKPQPGWPAEAQMNTAYVRQKARKIIKNNFDNLADFTKEARESLALSA